MSRSTCWIAGTRTLCAVSGVRVDRPGGMAASAHLDICSGCQFLTSGPSNGKGAVARRLGGIPGYGITQLTIRCAAVFLLI